MQTLGVIEHSISVHQAGVHYTWRMYDVGGAVRAFLILNKGRFSNEAFIFLF